MPILDKLRVPSSLKKMDEKESYERFIQAVFKELKWVKKAALQRYLDGQLGRYDPLFLKLLSLKLINDVNYEALFHNERPQAGSIVWLLVGAGMLDPKWFADLVRVENGFPLCTKAKGTFAEHLVSGNLVTYSDMMDLMQREAQTGRRVEALIADRGLVPMEKIYDTLADFLGVPLTQEAQVNPKVDAIMDFQEGFFQTFHLLPVRTTEKSISFCSDQPQSEHTLNYLATALGKKTEMTLCTPVSYARTRAALASLREQRIQQETSKQDEVPMQANVRESSKAIELDLDSTVAMVATLVQKAVVSRATDIHLEPRRRELNIRYRVDGFLYEVGRVDHQVGREIISRIKILADMDITERRLPQDGHFRFSTEAAEYDMRISTVPTNFGERMEIRLAEGGKVFTGVEKFDLSKADVEVVDGFIHKPHGIVLATGPVGSGKTTTLYSCISKIDQNALNVITIEDPIEYIISQASQIEVNYKVKFDFVHGLRAILRQDPDVILVGEIRDEETAKIAIRAGMTGMLVFSTLHANDAVGSVTTLANFQINRFLIANALVGSLAQRLVRRVCPHCGERIKPDATVRKALGLTQKDFRGYKLMRGKGCRRCLNTGYLSRTGIFEIFKVTKRVRSLIMSGETEEQIKNVALEEGLIPLRQACLSKVKNGLTTAEEFVRVLG